MTLASLFSELKRRHLDRAAIFYAGVAWLLVQVITQVSPYFDIATWVVRGVILTAVIGFPCAMAFAWFYEWTPEGIKRDSEVQHNPALVQRGSRRLDRAIIAVLSIAVVLLITSHLVVPQPGTEGASATEQSVAVMPLVNSTGDATQEYFSDGMSEELISSLSRLQKLKVISRNSCFKFKGRTEDSRAIGKALGVAYLVEGSVRRAQNRVRIAVALVRAVDGSNTWSETFDRDAADIFAVQSEIAYAVAAQLKVSLLGENARTLQQPTAAVPPDQNLEAYNALLKGNFYGNRNTGESFGQAEAQYRLALTRDPGYALAHARLAIILATQLATESFPAAQRKALSDEVRAEAKQAVQLNPNLGEAHRALGSFYYFVELNLRDAERSLRRALELAPQDGAVLSNLAGIRRTFGHFDESMALEQAAIRLDPLRGNSYYGLGVDLTGLQRFEEAETAFQQALALQPQMENVYSRLSTIQVLRGHAKEALALAQKEPNAIFRDMSLAIAWQAAGDRSAAQATLQQLVNAHAEESASQIASVYAYWKEPEQALRWLQHALDSGDAGVTEMLEDPFLAAYRGDPRFVSVARKVGVMNPEEANTPGTSAAAHSP